MELYLQFGYGMMEHCRQLLSSWEGGTVVLSPRDLNGDQLGRLSSSVTSVPNGAVVLDPQFYVPHSDHERLCSHDYWPAEYETGGFWSGPQLTELLSKLLDLNRELGSSAFILPGLLARTVNDDWLEIQRATVEEARALDDSLPLFQTLALSDDAAKSQDQIELLLERSRNWQVDGYYLVCEHPNGEYLVDDPNWLANVLDLTAGLRLQGAKVVVGYCNQQMLIAATAKANAICSGTWMNVRSFPPEKFQPTYDEEIRQRSKWYYAPGALSEYKIPFLDIADRVGMLSDMAPSAELGSEHCSVLFTGAQPTTVGFSEQAAFRHYLHCLRGQTLNAERSSFDETVEAHEELLDAAEDLLGRLVSSGVRGQKRDFFKSIDVNRAALGVLKATRGPVLRRRWAQL